MKPSLAASLLLCICFLSACTYEGIRIGERRECAAMPQSQAERCYDRTRMTKEEYDTERDKLKRSQEASKLREVGGGDRYEKWIP